MAAEPALPLVHLDDAMVVVNKPAGLPSVPGRAAGLQDCMASRVQAEIADALVVHRLDMATSGLLLFARGAQAQRLFSEAFAHREVDKRYVAIVAGHLREDAGEIELPLLADWPRRPRQKIDPVHGKPSLTRWHVLDRTSFCGVDTTRVALQPVTGRSHQLRVHLWGIGHPVLGDTLYAPETIATLSVRLLLHANTLRVPHVTNGGASEFEAPVPF